MNNVWIIAVYRNCGAVGVCRPARLHEHAVRVRLDRNDNSQVCRAERSRTVSIGHGAVRYSESAVPRQVRRVYQRPEEERKCVLINECLN